ncbi:MAG: (Fe-S)-binding protein, partial [Chitinophagaceae bacterium]
MKIQLFIPCFVDQLYPQTGFNMVSVLEKAGCEVSYNPKQTCCGQPAFNAGFWDESRSICTKFLKDFSGAEHIVAPSASCVGFVRNYYSKLFEGSSYQKDAKLISENIFEFSEFLVNKLEKIQFGATLNGKATYHDSCAGLRECKIKNEPRLLLQNVEGLEIVE